MLNLTNDMPGQSWGGQCKAAQDHESAKSKKWWTDTQWTEPNYTHVNVIQKANAGHLMETQKPFYYMDFNKIVRAHV